MVHREVPVYGTESGVGVLMWSWLSSRNRIPCELLQGIVRGVARRLHIRLCVVLGFFWCIYSSPRTQITRFELFFLEGSKWDSKGNTY